MLVGTSARISLALLLLLAYVVAFAERQLPAALAAPLMVRFGLDDAHFGLLHGYGFALFYAGLAVPAGWIADRVTRIRLLACGVAVSAVATLAGGFAQGVAWFVVARMFVGIGQSVLVPTAYSLLGDALPRQRLGLGTAAFAVGPFLGAGIALALGGPLAQETRWQVPFWSVGGAGVVLAALLLWLPEPERKSTAPGAQRGDPAALRFLRKHWRPILAVDLAMVFNAMAGHAMLGWVALWLMRSHGHGLDQATIFYGASVLAGGVAGTFAAGLAGDALRRSGGAGRLHLQAVATAGAALVAGYLFSGLAPARALALLPLLIALLAAGLAAGSAALQEVTPPQLRGLQHGIAVFLINLLAMGLGPLIVGLASMTVDPAGGALGSAMGTAIPLMFALAALVALLGATGQRRAAQALD